MIKYLKISVIEHLANPQNFYDMQNFPSAGFFFVKDAEGLPSIVQVIQNNIGLLFGSSISYSQDTVFPLLDSEEISKPQTDTLKKELEELKKKYASLESEYKTANESRERLQKKELEEFRKQNRKTIVNGNVLASDDSTDYVHVGTVIKLIKGLK